VLTTDEARSFFRAATHSPQVCIFAVALTTGMRPSTRGGVGFNHMKHNFATGLTLRAGAFPMVSIMFAWGGPEGTHNIFNMNSSLLNGSARPLLD
jgi:hypothetical protein